MATLLVIDDEESLLYSLESGLAEDGLTVRTAATGQDGVDAVRNQAPEAVVLDMRLPDMTGLDVFDRIRRIDPHLPVILLTAFATTETAIEAMKRGAFEYLLKPIDLHRLRDVVRRAFDARRMQHVPAVLEGEPVPDRADEIVGRSPKMQDVYKLIGRIASQDASVLVLGESGTGKELVVRALYQHSSRATKPFLAIDCTSLSEAALEAELFGDERDTSRGEPFGKLQQLNGGTLFLDEIADMGPTVQARLLRFLESRQLTGLGNRTRDLDVRVIAASNRDLESLAAGGHFRSDLLYRLNGYSITLPPLRERRGDVAILAHHFLKSAAARLGRAVREISPEALAILERHSWPGNVRELQNVIRFAVIQAVGEALAPESLPAVLREGTRRDVAAYDAFGVRRLVDELLSSGSLDIYRRVLMEVDRAMLEHILQHVKGNQVHASELLGISRTTLRSKLQAIHNPAVES